MQARAELAIVSGSTGLADVLVRMRDSGHAAALARLNGGLVIVTAKQVFAQLREDRHAPQTIESLTQRASLHPLSFLPARDSSSNWTRRPEVTHGLAAALESGEGQSAILKEDDHSAIVLTADPLLAESFNLRISLCRCKAHPETHVFQPHELLKPGECNLDTSSVDCV